MSTDSPTTLADGVLETAGDKHVVRFQRHLAHPIERVWAALTEPSRLGDWLAGDSSDIELRVGGRVHLAGHDDGIESTVLALDPPHLIEYGWKTKTWDGGTIRWEVSEQDGGSRLRLTHRMPEIDLTADREIMKRMGLDPDTFPPIPRTLAGWHTMLDRLERTLEGGDQLPDDHWKTLFDQYADAGAGR